MILNCNSCEKKFVVPDNAIPATGRMVQCGSCGNKWKQLPLIQKKIKTTNPTELKAKNLKKSKPKKNIKTKIRKPREINLYSPEYLAKKHGIKLTEPRSELIKSNNTSKVSLGFYNSILLFLVFIIFISRLVYFTQDFIVENLPISKFYLDYFFESIRNIFEIWKNLITSY